MTTPTTQRQAILLGLSDARWPDGKPMVELALKWREQVADAIAARLAQVPQVEAADQDAPIHPGDTVRYQPDFEPPSPYWKRRISQSFVVVAVRKDDAEGVDKVWAWDPDLTGGDGAIQFSAAHAVVVRRSVPVEAPAGGPR